MSFLSLLIIVGPIVAIVVLGSVFFWLANSGYLGGYKYVGWALLGAELVITFSAVVGQASAEGMGFIALFYILFLTYMLAMQASPIAELLILTFAPDRSAGLKLLKSYSIAERMIIEEDLSGSITEYEDAVADDPSDIEARLRLAEVLFQNAEYRKAVEAYESALRIGKGLGAERRCLILTRLAQIDAEQLGELDKARNLLETIIKKYPDTRFSNYAEERMARL